jgi:predicted amidohydrolase
MRVAAIQMNSCEVIQENLIAVDKLIRSAAEKGATFICTPEVTDQMLSDRSERLDECFMQADHPGVPFFSALAKELSIYLLIGSMIIKDRGATKIHNRSFLFSPLGEVQATYDKMHLCDTDLPDGKTYCESACYVAGTKAVVAEVNGVGVGLTICRDLRFGRMYRALAGEGAKIITVPAAWLKQTGDPHWEVLLRARAIETGSYIVAPDQVGAHAGGRETYGRSMIIDPWGNIVCESDKSEEDILVADIDLSLVVQARKVIPCLIYNQEYQF